jgi:hypothetical protein
MSAAAQHHKFFGTHGTMSKACIAYRQGLRKRGIHTVDALALIGFLFDRMELVEANVRNPLEELEQMRAQNDMLREKLAEVEDKLGRIADIQVIRNGLNRKLKDEKKKEKS